MSSEQEQQFVGSLAELLVDWIEAHPGRLPEGLRSSRRSDLVHRLSFSW
jgi:hypothetical protein